MQLACGPNPLAAVLAALFVLVAALSAMQVLALLDLVAAVVLPHVALVAAVVSMVVELPRLRLRLQQAPQLPPFLAVAIQPHLVDYARPMVTGVALSLAVVAVVLPRLRRQQSPQLAPRRQQSPQLAPL